jgi:hypothetical protein
MTFVPERFANRGDGHLPTKIKIHARIHQLIGRYPDSAIKEIAELQETADRLLADILEEIEQLYALKNPEQISLAFSDSPKEA